MTQHLQNIQQKSEDAISSLVHLSNSNLLRKYSSTFEYLNKFYLKLLNQNCAFELFFLELEESAEVADKQSLCSNSTIRVKDSVACNECDFGNASVTETTRKLFHPSFERNIFQTCFDRSVSRCSNSILQELQILDNSAAPLSNTTDNTICNVTNSQCTVVVESATTDSVRDIHEMIPEVSLGLKNQYIRSTNLNKEPEINNPQCTVPIKSEVTHAVDNKEARNINKENNTYTSTVSNDTLNLNSFINVQDNKKESEIKEENNSDSSTVSNDSLNLNLNNEETCQTLYSGLDDMKSVAGNMSLIDSISISSDQITEPEITKEEAVLECSELNTEIDITDTKDIKVALKNVEERFKEKQSKRPFEMPDLRPTVKKNNYSNEGNIPLAVDNNVENKSIRRKIVPKKEDLDYNIIESPSSLYIQIIREENTLVDYLSDQIVEIANNLKKYKSKIDAHKAIDKYCVCYVEEFKAWYRAEIVKWFLDDDENVLVRLIDHGYTCMVRLMFIRKAISYFFALPIMAEKCELAFIKPPNDLDEWPEHSINYFYDIVNPQSNKLFTISFIERVGDTFMIDLESNDMDSLVQTLTVAGKAVENIPNETDNGLDEFMRKQILKSQSLDEDMSEEERIEKAFEFDDEEVDDPNIAVSHYSARDEAEICRIFLRCGKCFKGNNCRFSHKPLNPDGWTTDQEAVFYDSFYKLQLPNPGTEITVKIIHIVDIRTFYVVLKKFPYSAYLQNLPINTIKALVKLMNTPEEVKTYRTTNVIPAVSQMILVKYLDDLWQRGRVVNIIEYANRVELSVFLVDFGIDINVNMRDTRCIQEQHLQLPFQAVRCTLSNVVLKENMTDHENDMACDYLEINVLFKKLKARVTYNCEYLSVLLYNEADQDIGLELLKSGIVEECRQAITPREEQGFLVD
ncbi:krimper [Carabus blaptoides fortunei]